MKNISRYMAMASIFLSFASAKADPGKDLFEQVKAKYASCTSYSCEGEDKVSSDMMGKDPLYKSEKTFTIKFQRPDLLRVDWTRPPAPGTFSLYTENGKYQGVTPYQQTPKIFDSLESGMGTYAGISGGQTYFIPGLLLGKTIYFQDSSYRIMTDSPMEGKNCSTLEIVDKKTGKWILTLDKATLAILRAQHIQTVTAAQSKATMEEIKKTLKDKNTPMPQMSEHGYTVETTTTFKNVVFDQAMTPDDFVFKAK